MDEKKKCFVAMPYTKDHSLQEVYQAAIRPAVEFAGFDCVRADEITSAGVVIEHILKETYEADVVIADMTGSNPNVMYELGLAHGLAKPVILLTQDEKTPFDLQTYRIIYYNPSEFDSADSLRSKLGAMLDSLVAEPDSRSNPVRLFFPHIVDARPRLEAATARLEELEVTNTKLQGMADLAQSIIERLGAESTLEEIQGKMESEPDAGSVTIPVQGEGEKRSRLTFKRVPKNKRVKIPRKKK